MVKKQFVLIQNLLVFKKNLKINEKKNNNNL